MKLKCKRLIAFLSGLLIGLSSCLCMVVVADSTSTGKDVLDDTRYSSIGFGTVFEILSFIDDLSRGEISNPDLFPAESLINKFASKVAETAVKNTIDSANLTYGTAENYTIQSAFCIMGKRKLNYPNGNSEVQTCFVYVDRNVSQALPQQFGNYTIAPNTIFLVRDTSWGGVIPLSIPITDNNIALYTYNSPSGFSLGLQNPPNNTFVYDTPNGRESVGFRHGGNNYNPLYINFVNNSTNTIVINKFIDYYNDNPNSYNTYIPDGVPDNFEAFIGSGYWYEGSQGIMFTSSWGSLCPFYLTTAYFNGSSDFGTDKLNNTWSTDNNIDPSKPPAYILPNDNPLSSGKTINNNTINNYNDYGITSIDGQLELSPDILVGALGGLIDPDFAGALGGVFNAQPEIGLGFDTPLDLNLPDLVDDYIQSITIQPDVPDWTRPLVPVVTTYTHDFQSMILPTTQTMPIDISDTVEGLNDIGYDLLDNMNLVPVFGILTLLGILIWCIF